MDDLKFMKNIMVLATIITGKHVEEEAIIIVAFEL